MILITGGLGYLGGRLAEQLLQVGYLEIALGTSRVNADVPHELRKCRIINIDLLDDVSLDKACKGIKIIIHLAALNAQACARDPEKALMINGLGTLKLLQAAIRQGVSKLIYFSTAHVYGSPLIGEINEKTLPRPVHPYAITHRLAEDYVIEESRKGNIEGVVLRLSNAVGAPLDSSVNCWMLLVNDLCRQAVQDNELVLHSSGLQQRDFISIGDVAKVVGLMVDMHQGRNSEEIYNLGSGKSISVIEVARLVVERYKNQSGISIEIKVNNETAIIETTKLEYQIGKISSVVCFGNKTTLEQDIDKTLEFCGREFSG
jgi:UDP-glucose 4-epimerase